VKRTRLPKDPPTLEQALTITQIRTWKEFCFVNHWRHALINKKFAGMTEEDANKRFDENPGWEEECDLREQANLTDAEHEHLKRFESLMDEYDEWEESQHPERRQAMDTLKQESQDILDKLKALYLEMGGDPNALRAGVADV
jgi:hypothetical protein